MEQINILITVTQFKPTEIGWTLQLWIIQGFLEILKLNFYFFEKIYIKIFRLTNFICMGQQKTLFMAFTMI